MPLKPPDIPLATSRRARTTTTADVSQPVDYPERRERQRAIEDLSRTRQAFYGGFGLGLIFGLCCVAIVEHWPLVSNFFRSWGWSS